MKIISSIVFIVLLFSGCASTKVTEINNNFSTVNLEQDEKNLWQYSDDIEAKLNQALTEYDFQSLEYYLTGVLRKLSLNVIGGDAPTPRIRVLPDTNINAFVFPNGAAYINTGLLSAIENEAQLAFILSHELSHYQLRHGLKQARVDSNNAKRGMALGVLLAALAGGASGSFDPNVSRSVAGLWSMSWNSNYSRDLETEADLNGVKLMSDSNYKLNEAKRILEIIGHLAKVESYSGSGMFETHPKLTERITGFESASTKYNNSNKNSFIGQHQYLEQILYALRINTELNVKSGRLEIAKRNLESYLKHSAPSATTHFLNAKIASRQGSQYSQEAISHYEQCVSTDPNFADAYFELGHAYGSAGLIQKSEYAFNKFLQLKPDAPEVNLIEEIMSVYKQTQ